MGWTFTWFLADETERASALHGWKMPTIPTSAPKRRTGRNPFTGERIEVWEYGSPPAPAAEPDADLVDYEELPHFASRMDLDEVGNLLGLLTGREHVGALLQHLRLGGPEDLENAVHWVPPELVTALASAPQDLRALAAQWTALRPEPDRWEGDEIEGRTHWLEQLIGLAGTAVRTQRQMFVEWQV